MRIVGIVVVLAIVYYIYGRNGDKTSLQNRVAEAQAEAAQVMPAPQSAQPPAAQPPPTNSLRAPMDRTRQVLDQVKQRNGKGEF